ncbi:MAG: holo-ACP synthase [Rectinemataceae bacterium]
MILGIGIDVVHVRRIRHWLVVPGLVERFFHPDEVSIFKERGDAAALSLAARFAAKEAFGKAIGSGLSGINLRDIKVINNHNGKPEITLFGTALERLEALGGTRVHVSLTHESDNAIALAIIED